MNTACNEHEHNEDCAYNEHYLSIMNSVCNEHEHNEECVYNEHYLSIINMNIMKSVYTMNTTCQ